MTDPAVNATTLQLFWFVLVGVLLTGYAVLDGFDLGVGILHPFARGDHERRVMMNSIGPLWDGNEVWLVTFGGALFAAFPNAYATAFSVFYTPFMLLLFALIFRAVSLEFRSKFASPLWRGCWDAAFCGASTLAAFLYGVAVGNSVRGLPIRPAEDGYLEIAPDAAGDLLVLLHPYTLLVGCLAVAVFALHGAVYLYLKTDGELQRRVHGWLWRAFFVFLALYVVASVYTLVQVPSATANFRRHPWVWLVVLLNVLAIANIPRAIHLGKPVYAFVSSCCTIMALVFLFGVALFPNLLLSGERDPATGVPYHLNVVNAASSEATLQNMAIVAFLGMPFVMSYTAVVYWVFRGKVQTSQLHY